MFVLHSAVRGLSSFNESATFLEGFMKPSRRLREAFAGRVFEKVSWSLQGASANPSWRFIALEAPRRVHEASSKGPWRNFVGFLR